MGLSVTNLNGIFHFLKDLDDNVSLLKKQNLKKKKKKKKKQNI